MNNKVTRIDSDGVRSVLNVGELAVDNYTAGDKGRLYTGDGSINKAIAFLTDINFKELTAAEINVETRESIGRVAYATDLEAFMYYKDSTTQWHLFSESSGDVMPVAGVGTGIAGVYTESWETAEDANTHWNSNQWGNLNDGNDAGKWNRRDGTTPSNGTGPNGSEDGTWYLYSEMSSNGHTVQFELETQNFAKLTEFKMSYHMLGAQCGDLAIVTVYDNTETVIWSTGGDQGDQWNEVVLDMSSTDAEVLRIKYSGSTGWQSDLCLDAIEITSV